MEYNVVIVSDESYIQHAVTMLCSLFETNKDKQFRIFCLTNGFTIEIQVLLFEFCVKYNSTIHFINPCEYLNHEYNYNLLTLPVGQWTTMMYYKLFMPFVLPKEVTRCLFLDGDMIINDDIEELYSWNLNGNIIGAVEDIPDCVQIKKRLALKSADLYVNSGVMVCDLDKWREMEKERPIFDFVLQVANRITNEQDVIAMYFCDKLSLLPIRWNMVTFYFMQTPKIFDKYLGELSYALKNPAIIHFAAPIKPWFRDCDHPYKSLYQRYLKLTPWQNNSFCYLRLWELWNTGDLIFEKLTPRKRLNKFIKRGLCRIRLMHNPIFLSK